MNGWIAWECGLSASSRVVLLPFVLVVIPVFAASVVVPIVGVVVPIVSAEATVVW